VIELVTILNGLLVLGVFPVEVQVDPRVAAVEIFLDGQLVARRDAPPWTFEVDFGDLLLPHLLEGIAIGPENKILDRTEVPVNGELNTLFLEFRVPEDEGWPPQRMRLLVEGLPGAPLPSAKVWQDSRLLAIDAQGFFSLKKAKGKASKLRALVREHGSEVVREIDFGGARPRLGTTSAVSLEIPPELAFEPGGWLTADGKEVEVLRAHQPPPVIALIWDANLPFGFSREGAKYGKKRGGDVGGIHVWKVSPGAGDRITLTAGVQRSGPRKGVLGVIRRLDRKGARREPAEQELFDAVAGSGVQLARSSRPRAALLLLDANSEDQSDFDLHEVADFLAILQIPFCVWIRGMEKISSPSEELCVGGDLPAVLRTLERSLARQHIAVLEGRHLPQTLSLSNAAPPAVRFAGR